MMFASKAAARDAVWTILEEQRLAAYPFPARGRIPNFRGAADAAKRLFQTPLLANACRIKVNPDSPQRFVRAEALRRGMAVYVPTPRLAGGFMRLDPARIDPADIWRASARANWPQFADPVALAELPVFDAIVTGSVAVTASGKRAGKGAGYSDLEFAILRELGHPPVPVATTVHDVQVVEDFPIAKHDQPLSLIATPTRTLNVAQPLPAPAGIDWALLDDRALAAMSVMASLKAGTAAANDG